MILEASGSLFSFPFFVAGIVFFYRFKFACHNTFAFIEFCFISFYFYFYFYLLDFDSIFDVRTHIHKHLLNLEAMLVIIQNHHVHRFVVDLVHHEEEVAVVDYEVVQEVVQEVVFHVVLHNKVDKEYKVVKVYQLYQMYKVLRHKVETLAINNQ